MVTEGTRGERVDAVARVTAAFAAEIDLHDPRAAISWARWPDVHALVEHLGAIHRWVAQVLLTGAAAPRDSYSPPPAGGLRAWYEEGRTALLDALDAVDPATSCWILGDRVGIASFWGRRMVFESVKHLTDIRAAGGGPWRTAEELRAADYADGIDELFSEFLPRSRPDLGMLPGPVLLRATDIDRNWGVSRDWTVGAQTEAAPDAAYVEARAGDLALFVWERADPLRDPARFRVSGDARAVAALQSAAIHP
ncbi:maleylpyruvate isomerase N-terminal domain-containing protein [Microbacterium sp. LRZ72]|uniref:maleylpyruvate isomerase N-terminal domain-containing protein n=1 Tax=Microbacterium sp. LRZ72 TaxID=2942481 RepID=UPI0029AF8D77|nr:maleylpyruvate isomerase N-terminal domain-containing protein [Microbacterium sp. LRZ72]MDX2376750.1 maleylpyruvate isomerase N-terminal domain-containing protein [Microbacterium sp. LRZ72]